MAPRKKPLVLITGARGRIGGKLREALAPRYRLAGLDIKVGKTDAMPVFACDLTSDDSVANALAELRGKFGDAIAAVVHLAAYFDFIGEEKLQYRSVNVEGTRRLLQQLRTFKLERFVYVSTMLVHAPVKPGELIDEDSPIGPRWAYPQSKAEAEAVVAEETGKVPYTILRLAGVYDEDVVVPTLAHQIARIYEREPEGALYSGDLKAGQSFLHSEDMARAVAEAVDRRKRLPKSGAILVGEAGAPGYEQLQKLIGATVHGEGEWTTLSLPKPLAKIGAALQMQVEPIVPDSVDQGERPFIRPFMIDMASDHYALDIGKAGELLDWRPQHKLETELPAIVERLKADPLAWYAANGLVPPAWMRTASEKGADPERVRGRHEQAYRLTHQRFLWAHFANIFLGLWLLTSPAILGYAEPDMMWSDWISGVLLMVFGALSLNWRTPLARFGAGIVGLWVLFAPLVFWTPSAAAYLNDTLVGALAISFATAVRPFPFIDPVAAQTGPDIPPGWDFSPSTFIQRAPIIALALIGFFVSRYLTAYQLGHVDGIWEPFFAGSPANPRNGTEEIITSEVSKAWPVPDAGIGAATYMLEIITGLIGSSRRWRTMPWLVLIFGLMIVPLGIVSVTFIIIQPIVLGTWCTLCLIAAAAMVVQIPYSLDELVATGQFLVRKRAEKALLRAFLFGDTDKGSRRQRDDFDEPFGGMIRDMEGGVGFPWTLLASAAAGVWLMLTRLTLGTEGPMADADHLIGALVIVVAVTALAEVARTVRLLNLALGAALLITPFILGATLLQSGASLVAGLAIMALSLPRGKVRASYGSWNRYIV